MNEKNTSRIARIAVPVASTFITSLITLTVTVPLARGLDATGDLRTVLIATIAVVIFAALEPLMTGAAEMIRDLTRHGA